MSALLHRWPLAVAAPQARPGTRDRAAAAARRLFDFRSRAARGPGSERDADLTRVPGVRAGLVCRLGGPETVSSPGRDYSLCLGNGGDEFGELRPRGPG